MREKVIRKLTWNELELAFCYMAQSIADHWQAREIPVAERHIIPVTRGGMIPATYLAHMLHVPIKHAIFVKTYEGECKLPPEFHTIKCPSIMSRDIKTGVIVDDIIDTGDTALLIARKFNAVTMIAPVSKPSGMLVAEEHTLRTSPILIPQDTWVVFPWEDVLGIGLN